MYSTGNQVPSAALEDMADNAQVFDGLVTKTSGTVTDRLGNVRRPFQQIVTDMGFNPVSGSFQAGATITEYNQCLVDTSTGTFYSWSGALPKVVPAGSTPATTGGIGALLWVDRTDLMLRNELSSDTGATLQAYKRSGVAWAVKRSLQDVFDASCVDLTGVDPSNIQTALDYCYTLSEYSVVQLPKSLSLTSGLTVRVDKVQLKGPCVINFSGMSAGVSPSYTKAITLTSASNPPYYQVHTCLKDLEMIGPGDSVAQVAGLWYNSDTSGSGVSHISLENVNIHGFYDAEIYRNKAYIINHYNCDTWDCNRAILMDTGLSDYGERISYVSCSIYNNNRILDANNAAGSIHFINCSLDYNSDFGEVDAGYVKLTDCHVEMSTYIQSYFKANGVDAAIDMDGGWLLCTATGPHNSDSFAYAADGASVRIKPTKSNNMQNTANRWGKCQGQGIIDVDIYNSYRITDNPTITADSNNLLSGNFGYDTIVNDIFITDDTAPITSRTVGNNINIVTSSDTYRSSPRSLKATKVFGGGSRCSFVIAVPIQQHKRMGCELWYKKMDTATGAVYVSHAYGSGYKIDSNGVPSFAKTTIISTANLTFTSSPVDWTKLTRGEPVSKSPSWATHFLVEVNMNGKTTGSLYFDDVVITTS